METINDNYKNKNITFKTMTEPIKKENEIDSYTELIAYISSVVKKPIFEENLLTVISWIIMVISIIASISLFFKEEYIICIGLLFGSIISHCILRILCNISINLDSINKKLNK